MKYKKNYIQNLNASTLLEMVVALAVIVVVFAAIVVLFRNVQTSWASKTASAETVQNARVLMDHINRNLARAAKITAVSGSAETDGYIEFEDNDGNTLRYDIESSYIQFGPAASGSDLAGPVSSLQFTCYDACDLDTPITDVNSIHFVEVQTTLLNSAPNSQDKTFTTSAYLRANCDIIPTPMWSNTLEDDSTSTIDGGIITNSPSSYVDGAIGNAFAGNGSVYARWDDAEVTAIFDGAWDNDLGFTVDLYFMGDHWSSHSGDSGLWSVVRRNTDMYIIASVQNGNLRLLFREKPVSTEYKYHLTSIPLTNNVIYRLTMRQYNGQFEAYLDGGAYSNSSPVFTASQAAGWTCDFPLTGGSPSRDMTVGTRAIFGGTLQSGEWVDNVRVFNGYYTPAQIPIASLSPSQASNPAPADGAADIAVDTDLGWTAGTDAISHDVYFGISSPGTFQGNQASTTFDTGTMAENTTYYWRIDEVDANGTTTGEIWSFTTAGATSSLTWQSTLDNDASITVDGGSIVSGPSSYVTGAIDTAFAGNGSVYATWDNTDVENIFGSWNDSNGSTIDLYFRGDHWSTHSGDSGLWSVVDRYDGQDGYLIVSVRDGKLRFPYKDSYSGYVEAPQLTGITLANNVTYRLTVRQYSSNFEVYLDGGAYSNSSPVYTDYTWSETIAFPEYNAGGGGGGREMNIGNRSQWFGGILQSGEWVDHVRVYNGYYTPDEIP